VALAGTAGEVNRADVWWADLEPRSGSKQRRRQPVVVVPRRSVSQARHGPTAVALPPGDGRPQKVSTAICHQVPTLDWARLVERPGVLVPRELDEVERGLRAPLDPT